MEDDDFHVDIAVNSQNLDLNIGVDSKDDLEGAINLVKSAFLDDGGDEEDLIGWVNQLDQELSELEEQVGELDAQSGEQDNGKLPAGPDLEKQQEELAKMLSDLRGDLEDLRVRVEEEVDEISEQIQKNRDLAQDVDTSISDLKKKSRRSIACRKLAEKIAKEGIPDDWKEYHEEIRDEMVEEGRVPDDFRIRTIEGYTRATRDRWEQEQADQDDCEGTDEVTDESVEETVENEVEDDTEKLGETGEDENSVDLQLMDDSGAGTPKASVTVDVPPLDEITSLDDVQGFELRTQRQLVLKAIEENHWVGRQGVGEALFDERPSSGSKEYIWINDRIMELEDSLESKKDGRRTLFAPEGTGDDDSENERIDGTVTMKEALKMDLKDKSLICVRCNSKEGAFTDVTEARIHANEEDHDSWLVVNDDGPWNNSISVEGVIERELGEEVMERVGS